MGYNLKQYDAALDFIQTGDANITDVWDQRRVQAYDLYENIYRNATANLKLVLRGDDQSAILVPNGRKIVETTHRYLGKNVNFFVEPEGDISIQDSLNLWWTDTWKREAFPAKFASNKRWGLVRGDAYFYISANPSKTAGRRITIAELDPRQVFEIEDAEDSSRIIGVHIVDQVQDLREKDKPDKKVARRRTFKRIFDENTGAAVGVSSELTFWTIGKWDDRSEKARSQQEEVKDGEFASLIEEEFQLPQPIVQLPVYKWRTRAPQNSTWGESILAGLETLLYAINQSITDEDATLIFQGLGMYVTNAGAPLDENNEIADWTLGPKRVIELSGDQRFERVSGVSDVSPYTAHMDWINDNGISEPAGIPQIAVGRVDVAVAESGISLQIQMAPLMASNQELEIEIINTLDQMFFDITTMWLPAYETETFGGGGTVGEPTEDAILAMSECSVVCLFDDPMPKNRDAEVQEVVLLDSANLILKTMVIGKLRELGWKYPSIGPNGEELTDDDLAAMLLDQAKAQATALDPFAAGAGAGGGPVDEFGNPIQEDQSQNAVDQRVIDLGTT